MACFRRLAHAAFLFGTFFCSNSIVLSEKIHLLPLDDDEPYATNHTFLASAVDLSELMECSNFGQIKELHVQLERGGPEWDFQVDKQTSNTNAFVGLNKNHSARISLYRHKAVSLDFNLVTGVLHDSNRGFWYEIKPNIHGIPLVTVVTDAELAPFAEPLLPPLKYEPPDIALSQGRAETSSPPSVHGSIVAILKEARRLMGVYLPSIFPEDLDGYDKVAKKDITVDIMLVWTHRAECIKTHLPANCTVSSKSRQNMKLAIYFFLQETNTAFANSGLRLQLRLAHGRRVQYEESTFARALTDLRDGSIPTVKKKRKKHKADIVMMLIDREGDHPETGIAYNNYEHINADFMYSVVATQFTSIWYLPAHEIGHNFGCSHDRGTVDMCHDKDKTSYGYRDPRERFRTIMSYPLPTRHCDKLSERSYLLQERRGLTCPIIPYFSNNRKQGKYYGASLGGPNNNCAGQIERVQDRVSNLF